MIPRGADPIRDLRGVIHLAQLRGVGVFIPVDQVGQFSDFLDRVEDEGYGEAWDEGYSKGCADAQKDAEEEAEMVAEETEERIKEAHAAGYAEGRADAAQGDGKVGDGKGSDD